MWVVPGALHSSINENVHPKQTELCLEDSCRLYSSVAAESDAEAMLRCSHAPKSHTCKTSGGFFSVHFHINQLLTSSYMLV